MSAVAPDITLDAGPTGPMPAARSPRAVVDLAVDACAALVLTTIGLLGFGNAYGDTRYLIVGVVAAVAGAAVASSSVAWRLPVLAAVAVALGVFVAFSGVALPDAAVGGIFAGPSAPRELLVGVAGGWAELLTVAPPVGSVGHVLVVQYVCGFVGALLAVLGSRIERVLVLAIVPPAAVVVLSALFGTSQPAALAAQGIGFVAVAVAWTSLRGLRRRRIVHSTTRPRLVATIGLLVVVALGAGVVGDHLPGASVSDRYVLRQHTDPPFDPRAYPSPLSGYRQYVADESRKRAEVLRVRGLPDGVPLRLAIMDAYDGVVWSVGYGDGARGGFFTRVGERIDVGGAGTVATEVEVLGMRGPWVPTAGLPASLRYEGARAEVLGSSFRLNRTTGMAASTTPLAAGDRYRADVVVTPELPDSAAGEADVDTSQLPAVPDEIPKVFQEKAAELTADAPTPAAKARKLVEFLRAGFYSDGGEASGVAAGHSLARLNDMLQPDALVGNAEQYAALMGVLARSLGLPARVVMGFRPGPAGGGTVTGADVDAWVEIAFDGVGWVSFRPTPDKDREPQERPRTKPKPRETQLPQPPPPTILQPPTTQPELDDLDDRERNTDDDAPFTIPTPVLVGLALIGGPTLLLVAVTAAIAGIKRRRRVRRRSRGAPAVRIAGGWREVVDRARDVGLPVPKRATRTEVARSLATASATGIRPNGIGDVARHADVATFGPEDPSDAVATEFWALVDRELKSLVEPLDRRARWRATVSLASLRRGDG